MIVCEYCFKDFHARGSDAYLTAWATKVDQMAVEGWEVVEYVPRSLLGQWTVLFSKSSESGASVKRGLSVLATFSRRIIGPGQFNRLTLNRLDLNRRGAEARRKRKEKLRQDS